MRELREEVGTDLINCYGDVQRIVAMDLAAQVSGLEKSLVPTLVEIYELSEFRRSPRLAGCRS